MRIGYACLAIGVDNAVYQTPKLANVTTQKLMDAVASNIQALEALIDYNIKNGIHHFRISSDLIPFGSSPVNNLPWWDLFQNSLDRIGAKIATGIRVSMHPGQYTVLNSPSPEIVARAVADLRYHARVLDALHTGQTSKIILHIGGVYDDKAAAIARFKENFRLLDVNIKRRIVIENDDRSYNIMDVLAIARDLAIPAVFDNLHNHLNPSPEKQSDAYWIKECRTTWKNEDGRQKMHYSQASGEKRNGAHSSSIAIIPFLEYFKALAQDDIDIMLEVKDKNLSALKCQNCLNENGNIKTLESEWARYKYSVLARSQSIYQQIRELLKDKKSYPALAFYSLIENALALPNDTESAANAAEHVWGYFKDKATPEEKATFFRALSKFQSGQAGIRPAKNSLHKLAEKYHEEYLLVSLYWDL